MRPPIFQLCVADPGVTSLLGQNPTRLFEFGRAVGEDGQPPPKPYAVWQNVGGSPENLLADRPKADGLTIQVDVYGASSSSVEDVARAIAYAVELNAYVVGWFGAGRDPETNDYRFTFQIDFLVDREVQS